MSKYKFIGTEQDLIDNGFEKYNDIDWLYSKLTNHPMFEYEMIVMNLDNKDVFFVNTTLFRIPDKYNMKKWIDKGLVIENDV